MDGPEQHSTNAVPLTGRAAQLAALTGGSRKGIKNKATAKREKEIAASGLTPLDYMLSVLRDETQDQGARMDAAKSAAPYVHPKLATVAHTGPDGGALIVQILRLADLP